MIYNVLIIGFGNIGFRHLQAINKSSHRINITIVDKNINSFKKLKYVKSKHNINNYLKINKIQNKNFFLTIIATDSKNRYILIKTLLKNIKTKNLIIEKVLEQSYDNLIKLKNLLRYKRNCWVNSPYKSMDVFKQIKYNIPSNSNHLVVKGFNWGMACNFFHQILIHNLFFKNSKLADIKIDQSSYWLPSKRRGYYEIFGKIKLIFKKSKLTLICKNKEKKETSCYYIISKDNEKFIKYKLDSKNFIKNRIKYKCKNIELQSNLSNIYLDQLIKNNKCKLPKLNNSINLHLPLIKSLHKHWQKYYNKNTRNLPIT